MPERHERRDPLDRLPHAGPARLPDAVDHLEAGVRVSGRRSLKTDDACLNQQGFLPQFLLIELMAQVGGLLMDDADRPGDYAMLAGIKRMHMHGTARAGQTVIVDCSLVRRLGNLYLIEARGRTPERELAHGTIQISRVRSSG